MEERTDRLVDHLEASLASSECRERRYHLRHALQYARALQVTEEESSRE
jgi:1,2-phenylacetyl-CoA epoxidase catalytic subunit